MKKINTPATRLLLTVACLGGAAGMTLRAGATPTAESQTWEVSGHVHNPSSTSVDFILSEIVDADISGSGQMVWQGDVANGVGTVHTNAVAVVDPDAAPFFSAWTDEQDVDFGFAYDAATGYFECSTQDPTYPEPIVSNRMDILVIHDGMLRRTTDALFPPVGWDPNGSPGSDGYYGPRTQAEFDTQAASLRATVTPGFSGPLVVSHTQAVFQFQRDVDYYRDLSWSPPTYLRTHTTNLTLDWSPKPDDQPPAPPYQVTGGFNVAQARKIVADTGAFTCLPFGIPLNSGCSDALSRNCGGGGWSSLTGSLNGGSQAIPYCSANSHGSVISNADFGYIHSATDYDPPSASSGCSSCGGSAPSGGGAAIGLTRILRPKDLAQPGSLGLGGFLAFDTSATLAQMNGGLQIDLFDPAMLGPVSAVDGLDGEGAQDGVFHDLTTQAVAKVAMLDAGGQPTASFTAADLIDVVAHDGAVTRYQVLPQAQGSSSRQCRALYRHDARGYGWEIAYAQPDANQITDPSQAFVMDRVQDAQGQTLVFVYGATPVAGRPAVSHVALPNGQTLAYAYGDTLHLTEVKNGAATLATFAYANDSETNTTKLSIQDGGAPVGDGVKDAYLTNAVSANGTEATNQPAMRIRLLTNGGDEVKYLSLSGTAAGLTDNQRLVYEGTGKLKFIDGPWEVGYYQEGWTIGKSGNNPVQVTATLENSRASAHPNNDYDLHKAMTSTFDAVTDERGETVQYTYDADGFPLTKTWSDGTSETFAYDALKRVVAHTDRQGRSETSTYDTYGNLLTRTEGTGAEAGTTTYAYYPQGHPNQHLLQSETDANGNTTDYAYDANQRLVSKTLPADSAGGPRATYTYEYDSAGRLSKSIDPVGRFAQYTYDSRNHVVHVNYCDVSFEQNIYGQGAQADYLLASRDRDGNWTAYRYDAQGRTSQTISGLAEAQATDPAFVPDPTYHAVTRRIYEPGTSRVSATVRNGEKTTYTYDYRGRQVAQTVYSGKRDANNAPIGLTTTTTYLDNKVFKTTDAYGRSTFRAYRASDNAQVRSVREATPGSAGNLTTYADVLALTRNAAPNAPYTIEDSELDASGLQVASIGARGIRSETQYDSRGRAIIQKVAIGTPVEAQSQTIYDPNANVIEQRGARYFDPNDQGGYQKARTVTTYTGRNRPQSVTDAPGTPEAGTVSYTYYLDGKQATMTLPNGNVAGATQAQKEANTTLSMVRPLCGWALGNIDQAGHGTLTNTSVGGDVIHIIQVKDLKSLTTTLPNGLVVPNFLNEVDMDVPDANTLSESTTQYDSRHRPIASTVWSGALGAVNRADVPVWYNGSVQGNTYAQSAVPSGVTGQTTLYYYSEDLTGASLTHPFAPAISLSEVLAKLPANIQIQDISNGFAQAQVTPTGEVVLSIQDGAGRTLIQAQLDNTPAHALVTWSTQAYDAITASGLLETTGSTALGHTTKSHSDGLGRTREQVDALGNIASAEYDANGNLTKSRDANGVGQDCTYDAQNRRISCTDTFGSTRTTKYSQAGLMLNQQDGKNIWNATDAIYDARGRVTQTGTRLTGDLTTYTYDANGNRLSVIDGEGKTTRYTYNNRNQKVDWTFPGQTSDIVGSVGYDTVQYRYDGAARLVEMVRQDGTTEESVYNFNGTLAQKIFKNADDTVESADVFTYDAANRPLTATKGRYGNTITYTHDTAGRKQTESLTLNPGNAGLQARYDIQYAYDQDSRPIQIIYPSGKAVTRAYTERNQLANVAVDSQNIGAFQYDAGGRETQRTLSNGASQTRTYRTDGLLQAITTNLPSGTDYASSLTYSYDQNKNLTAETFGGGATAGYSATMAQDAKDRLINQTRSNGAAQNWALTKEGDWSQFSGTTGGLLGNFNQTRSHNDKHQVTTLLGAAPGSVLPLGVPEYDLKGNLTKDENGLVYTWDQENKLKKVELATTTTVTVESPGNGKKLGHDKNGDGIDDHQNTNGNGHFSSTTTVTLSEKAKFTYDALGRRVSKTANGNTTVYVSAGNQEIAEYTNGALTKEHVYGTYVDENLATKDAANGWQYRIMDRRYSTTALLDAVGAVIERYVYDAYGKTTALTVGGTLTGNAPLTDVLWTGRRLDAETGNYYFRSRYFSTTLGRFISRDINYLDGWNLYGAYFAMKLGRDPSGKLQIGDVYVPDSDWEEALALQDAVNGITKDTMPNKGSSKADREAFGHLLQDVYAMFQSLVKPCCQLDACTLAAQWMNESSWGRSGLSQNAFNFGGIKGDGPAGSYNAQTGEHINGQDVVIRDNFRAYHNVLEFMSDYTNLICGNDRYKNARGKSGEEYFKALKAAGYATDPNYVETSMKFYRQLGCGQ